MTEQEIIFQRLFEKLEILEKLINQLALFIGGIES